MKKLVVYLLVSLVVEGLGKMVLEDRVEDGEILTPDGLGVEFQLRCESSEELCGWARRSFVAAAAHLGNAISFGAPIRVMASFVSFCKKFGECHLKEPAVGISRPTRFYPLVKNGIVRMYPQALMRQIYDNLDDQHPFDIVMAMNADSFNNPSTPLLEVLSHELIHGLGFVSSLVQSDAGVLPWPTSSDTRLAFAEFAMDEFLFDTRTNLPLSNFTAQLPQNTNGDIERYIQELATHAGTLELRIGSLVVPLETSLSPFRIGSSVSHLDWVSYAHTQDVLMVYRINKGKTVKEYITSHTKWATAPYGPHTLKIMEALGYTLNPSPDMFKAYNHATSSHPTPILLGIIISYLTSRH